MRHASSQRSTPAPTARRQFRVAAPIEKTDDRGEVTETYWHPLGRAFENEGREGKPPTITVLLNAHPIGNRFVLFEDDGESRGGGREDRG